MDNELKIIMHLETYNKLKNYKYLTDSERDEIVAYIAACESEIHRLQGLLEERDEL